ncbi:hypothetical protein ZHAS_00013933 [Anopheles sinensis]|uniref:Uncharacterized protein n=1 Tax=Anopheles sinensis TaxID=74873 RepID=A0A084W6V7_ANOSI|nr:hypothetical protein ZHAS_00013933 [Anopheles sinensis]
MITVYHFPVARSQISTMLFYRPGISHTFDPKQKPSARVRASPPASASIRRDPIHAIATRQQIERSESSLKRDQSVDRGRCAIVSSSDVVRR